MVWICIGYVPDLGQYLLNCIVLGLNVNYSALPPDRTRPGHVVTTLLRFQLGLCQLPAGSGENEGVFATLEETITPITARAGTVQMWLSWKKSGQAPIITAAASPISGSEGRRFIWTGYHKDGIAPNIKWIRLSHLWYGWVYLPEGAQSGICGMDDGALQFRRRPSMAGSK